MSVLMHGAYSTESIANAMVINGEHSPAAAITHIKHQLEKFKTFQAVPIAVFDGKPRPAKDNESEARSAARKAAA